MRENGRVGRRFRRAHRPERAFRCRHAGSGCAPDCKRTERGRNTRIAMRGRRRARRQPHVVHVSGTNAAPSSNAA
ncbi:hypothetical protein DB771_01690 [Burkholderia sp. AU29985]|nr:hypothetical protein XM57_22425 [Burkholderia cepacia]AYZ94263.1 hypothetical protein EGY28_03790 [Burkholderia dolosa]ETP63641.1 hypothetical protein BDSB_16245 [Burkholderia dolosa PC543]PRE39760.1 hypothetical protein C6P87_29785 [Burkholderia sp. AU12872]PUA78605.1 hypothetical protein DB771_01690 [Burkholderia sp. AU29985]